MQQLVVTAMGLLAIWAVGCTETTAIRTADEAIQAVQQELAGRTFAYRWPAFQPGPIVTTTCLQEVLVSAFGSFESTFTAEKGEDGMWHVRALYGDSKTRGYWRVSPSGVVVTVEGPC